MDRGLCIKREHNGCCKQEFCFMIILLVGLTSYYNEIIPLSILDKRGACRAFLYFYIESREYLVLTHPDDSHLSPMS